MDTLMDIVLGDEVGFVSCEMMKNAESDILVIKDNLSKETLDGIINTSYSINSKRRLIAEKLNNVLEKINNTPLEFEDGDIYWSFAEPDYPKILKIANTILRLRKIMCFECHVRYTKSSEDNQAHQYCAECSKSLSKRVETKRRLLSREFKKNKKVKYEN